MNDGRILTGLVLLGLTVASAVKTHGSRGLHRERPGQRAVAELDGVSATGETIEEAAARLGANLYLQEGRGDDAYARAWRRLSDGLLDANPEIDPEAVNALYERFVAEAGW